MRSPHALRSLVVLALLGALLLVHAPALAQQARVVTGRITEQGTGAPLPGVNVFLDGTTVGRATDGDGRYTIAYTARGDFELVASMIGYDRATVPLSLAPGDTLTVDFTLRERTLELEGVTVEGNNRQWLERLERFRRYFLGRVDLAYACELANPEVLVFEQRGDALIARAEAPLRMRNRGLGYDVTFYLTSFTIRGRGDEAQVIQQGWERFEPLTPASPAEHTAWMDARQRAYDGSFRHFLHVLSRDRLETSDFTVRLEPEDGGRGRGVRGARRRVGRRDNFERVRSARRIARPATPLERAQMQRTGERIPSDRLLVLTVEAGKRMVVTYTAEREEIGYARARTRRPRRSQTSTLRLRGDRAVVNVRTGRFVPPSFFFKGGYWNYAETAAALLPYDYQPNGP
jgi:hypothetical protein